MDIEPEVLGLASILQKFPLEAGLSPNFTVFTDIDGKMPEGDWSGVEAAKRFRQVMTKPVLQFDMNAELPDPSESNNSAIAGLFSGAKNYSV